MLDQFARLNAHSPWPTPIEIENYFRIFDGSLLFCFAHFLCNLFFLCFFFYSFQYFAFTYMYFNQKKNCNKLKSITGACAQEKFKQMKCETSTASVNGLQMRIKFRFTWNEAHIVLYTATSFATPVMQCILQMKWQ